MKTNLNKWIELDTNPIIIFSQIGKVLYLNNEAEYLFGFVNEKEIFNLAINNAINNKFQTIVGEYRFDKFEFGAITVGIDGDEIGIRLHKIVTFPKKTKNIKDLEKINLFFILDFCKNYSFLDKNVTFIDEFDVDIPQFYTKKRELIELLNKIFSIIKDKKIKIIIKFAIGEKILLNSHNYSVVSIEIVGNFMQKQIQSDFFNIIFNHNKIQILVPFIKKI